MSHNRRNILGRGLLVAASLGLSQGIGTGAEEPPAREPAAKAAPRVEAERFLLLSDGRLIRGVVSQDETSYLVGQKIGMIRYPKRQVEGAFDSVEEAYRYRLERAPEDDPAERLRLARWCMSLHLDNEAKILLQQVVELSPDHGPAKAMLTKIQQSEATRTARNEAKVDQEVQQTAGEAVHEDRAGALDSAVLRGAERRMGITGLPVIFDLPPALAVQRAESFKHYVHPVLQAYCARCHNAEYNGPFQLVPVRTRKQQTPDALRANLDATLRLVDRDNPAKSELLSSTLRPHGNDVRRRPIFSGSNDRAYQILAAWVASLRPAGGGDAPAPPAGRADSETGETFAAGRPRSAADPLDEIVGRPGDPRLTGKAGHPTGGGRSFRYVEGEGMVPEESRPGDPQEFPLPYMMGGPRPSITGAPAAKDKEVVPPPSTNKSRDTKSTGSTRPAADATANAHPAPDADAPAGPKKPVKIDQKLLERLLQRNTNRTPQGP